MTGEGLPLGQHEIDTITQQDFIDVMRVIEPYLPQQANGSHEGELIIGEVILKIATCEFPTGKSYSITFKTPQEETADGQVVKKEEVYQVIDGENRRPSYYENSYSYNFEERNWEYMFPPTTADYDEELESLGEQPASTAENVFTYDRYDEIMPILKTLARDIVQSAKDALLNPEANMSRESWEELMDTINMVNTEKISKFFLKAGNQDGSVEYPSETRPNIIKLILANWMHDLEGDIEGRKESHIYLDTDKPGVVQVSEISVTYPDKKPATTAFDGTLTAEKSDDYLTADGDVAFTKRSYLLNDDGVNQIVSLLLTLATISEEELVNIFDEQLAGLEPALKQACTRYFVESKSLVFDPENEFVVDWRVGINPFNEHEQLALFATLPGRYVIYAPPSAGNRFTNDPISWTKLVWRKEAFSDTALVDNEEPTEVVSMTIKDLLEEVPPEQHRHIQEQEFSTLRAMAFRMRRDSGGRRGTRPENILKIREQYRLRYQRFVEAFPDFDTGLPPDLPV